MEKIAQKVGGGVSDWLEVPDSEDAELQQAGGADLGGQQGDPLSGVVSNLYFILPTISHGIRLQERQEVVVHSAATDGERGAWVIPGADAGAAGAAEAEEDPVQHNDHVEEGGGTLGHAGAWGVRGAERERRAEDHLPVGGERDQDHRGAEAHLGVQIADQAVQAQGERPIPRVTAVIANLQPRSVRGERRRQAQDPAAHLHQEPNHRPPHEDQQVPVHPLNPRQGPQLRLHRK